MHLHPASSSALDRGQRVNATLLSHTVITVNIKFQCNLQFHTNLDSKTGPYISRMSMLIHLFISEKTADKPNYTETGVVTFVLESNMSAVLTD